MDSMTELALAYQWARRMALKSAQRRSCGRRKEGLSVGVRVGSNVGPRDGVDEGSKDGVGLAPT